jgi:hypothetical protein
MTTGRAGTAGSQVPRAGSEQISHTYDCDGRLVSLQDRGGAKVTYVQRTQFGRLVVPFGDRHAHADTDRSRPPGTDHGR